MPAMELASTHQDLRDCENSQELDTKKAVTKVDLYFREEFDRLLSQGSTQDHKKILNYPKTSGIERRTSQTEFMVSKGNINVSRTLPDIDMNSCLDFSQSEEARSCDELRTLFFKLFETRHSFRGRLPASKIGLLFTDAANTVLTKSFLQRTLQSESAQIPA